MKILIIGSGGREHAIAHAFSKSQGVKNIIVSPGNAGIALEYTCLPLLDHEEICEYCIQHEIGLVFIGPEQPIEAGLADILRERGIRVIGPSKSAARLESSKAFAKEIMEKAGVATARHDLVKDIAALEKALQKHTLPVVLKADGLAAGKGVIIANTEDEAIRAGKDLLQSAGGQTGILIEEFIKGWEVSLFAFTDGIDYKTTLFAQDHKQLYDEDRGPNTGGMGAWAPVPEAEQYREKIERDILMPVLNEMRKAGSPYAGVLYLGLMISTQGPKVIEFNCRFGDPEAQALLPLLNTDFLKLCLAITDRKLATLQLSWKPEAALAVVLAAKGYPGKYKKEIPIDLDSISSQIYYAGVDAEKGRLMSSGGRILSLVAKAENIQAARQKVYQDIAKMAHAHFVYRRDIGCRKNCLEDS